MMTVKKSGARFCAAGEGWKRLQAFPKRFGDSTMSAFAVVLSQRGQSFCGNKKRPPLTERLARSRLRSADSSGSAIEVGADFRSECGAVTGCDAVAVVDEAEGSVLHFADTFSN